jgi:hypothetical protein
MNFSLLNKLAFIANLAFLTAIVMRIYPFLQGTKLESLVLVTGLVISPFVNLIVNLYYGILFFRGGRPYAHFVQAFNTSAFGLQIILFLFFSGWIPLSNINP